MTAENLSFPDLPTVAEQAFQYSGKEISAISYVSTLAFEARDPLTIIGLAAEQIQSECDDKCIKASLEKLAGATERIKILVNSIIEYEQFKSINDRG